MGSRRYNLHFPHSDRDLLVVYSAFHKGREGEEASRAVRKNPPGGGYDYTIMEAADFARQLSAGVPFCVETLFMDPGAPAAIAVAGAARASLRASSLSAKTSTPEIAGFPAGGSGGEAVLMWDPFLWPVLQRAREAFLTRALIGKYVSDATGKVGLATV